MISLTASEKLTITILANSIAGPMSGGDRIWIECAKRWVKKPNVSINVFTTEEGLKRGQQYGLTGVNYKLWSKSARFLGHSVYLLYFWRTLRGCINALVPMHSSGERNVVFSSSDFLPDSIPAWVSKIKNKNVEWLAAFYLFAPRLSDKTSPYHGKLFARGLFYYISQLPALYLIRRDADLVWVTSEIDRWRFIDGVRFTPDKVTGVRGGVDVKTPASLPEPAKKEYDAVFIGRFHTQKGVLELIDIWRNVCNKKPNAKLAMIGIGELEAQVREKIADYGLQSNISLLGFKDGLEKLEIFKKSKLVVHPAVYDSGGMAACEAMACRLPGVSFDLPALVTYYPKGMLKTPCYDFVGFAENIVQLLENAELYEKVANDALDWAKEWDWDKRAEVLFNYLVDR